MNFLKISEPVGAKGASLESCDSDKFSGFYFIFLCATEPEILTFWWTLTIFNFFPENPQEERYLFLK